MINEYKKYIPYGIGLILIIIVGFYIYKAFKKIKGGINAAADITAKIVVYDELAKDLELSVDRVEFCNKIANEISIVLETNKGLTDWEKLNHAVWDSEIKETLKDVDSAIEMKLIASFYKKEFTKNNRLYDDLKTELNTAYAFNQIPFISSIA